jgi:hypothetical protein
VARSRKIPEPPAFACLGKVWRLSFRRPESEGGGLVRYHFGGDVRYSVDQNKEFEGCEIIKVRGKNPRLLWSPDLKALYVFPGFYAPDSAYKPGIPPTVAERAALAEKVFNQYDHGAKKSRGETTCAVPDYPEPKIFRCGSAYDVVYRSEKWNGKNGEQVDYNHHFSKSGAVNFEVNSVKNPKGCFIQGGRLTVNDRGIVY